MIVEEQGIAIISQLLYGAKSQAEVSTSSGSPRTLEPRIAELNVRVELVKFRDLIGPDFVIKKFFTSLAE